MTDINTLNAITQERARIREEVVELRKAFARIDNKNVHYVPLEKVLRIIRNDQTEDGTSSV